MKGITRVIAMALGLLCLMVPSAASTDIQAELVIIGSYVFPDLKPIIEYGMRTYSAETGREARFEYEEDLDRALLRTVGLARPVDVWVIPRSQLQRYIDVGIPYPLESLVPEAELAAFAEQVPSEVFLWGRMDDTLYCAYLPSRSPVTPGRGQPAFLCVSRGSRAPAEAWTLVQHLVLGSGTADSDADMLDNFMHKLFREQDALTIYRQVIHPDRKQELTGDPRDWTEERFIRYMEDFYERLNPIVSMRLMGQQGPGLVYKGDPMGRHDYPRQDVVQFEYQIQSGVEFRPEPGRYLTTDGIQILLPSQVRGSILGPLTTLTLSVHKQFVGQYPRRYVFHSPRHMFERFWDRE